MILLHFFLNQKEEILDKLSPLQQRRTSELLIEVKTVIILLMNK